MAFSDTHTGARAKAGSMLVVGGIHALIGLGLVAALSVTVSVSPPVPNPTGVLIETDPPPIPPEPTETPRDTIIPPSNPAAPLPDFPLATSADFKVELALDDPLREVIRLPGPPTEALIVPPRPGPTFSPTAPIPRNGPQGWITTGDYPARDLRLGHAGTARYRVVVDSNGRVSTCEITASTGHAGLDQATCRHIERRARFDPAKNGEAKPAVGSYTGVVTWQIPD